MPEPVVIAEYDPAWPQRYDLLRKSVLEAVGEVAAEIEHVGSTAVPGLAAKPTIDIVVLLKSADGLPATIESLARIGYRHEGDLGITGREAFATPPGFALHDHHLYVCHPDWSGYTDQIDFRDYLRTHAEIARAYAQLKRSLALKYRDNRADYTAAKSTFVRDVLLRAKRDAR